MNILRNVLAQAAWSGAFISTVFSPLLSLRAQGQVFEHPAVVSTVNQVESAQLPDSPGTTLAQAQVPASPQTTPSQTPTQPATQQSAPSQAPNQPAPSQIAPAQNAPQNPVGTAAAEAPSTSGVAASQPAGAAIAPAKQRRARTVIIRTGAIIGAAVAVGVVVGLTAATSSKPPGAH
jgi:cytoskeletal protein RodZ